MSKTNSQFYAFRDVAPVGKLKLELIGPFATEEAAAIAGESITTGIIGLLVQADPTANSGWKLTAEYGLDAVAHVEVILTDCGEQALKAAVLGVGNLLMLTSAANEN